MDPQQSLVLKMDDILDLDPSKSSQRKAFKGKCLLLVQSTEEKGIVEIIARSNGLGTGNVKINSK
jgi:beta-galactosidase